MPGHQGETRRTRAAQEWESPGYESPLPVTEKSNPLSRDIDRAGPQQIVRVLQECDAEVFQGDLQTDAEYKRLYSESVVQILVNVAKRVKTILKEPENSLIVLSGCGTSGRIAFLLSNTFNRILARHQQKPVYSYTIAGGDKALLTSQEAPEDSPSLGAQVLEETCAGKKHVLFIGISCGLSAPFVAGQLDFCLNNLDIFTPVLIGFNPAHMARAEPIQGWPHTLREVTERMLDLQRGQRAFVLNPVVGPEAISGSSRMKGGTATKVLLESLLLLGHRAVHRHSEINHQAVLDCIRDYETVHEMTYSKTEELADVIGTAGISLQNQGHVYYLGWKTLGIMGIIDASECIPTFGADFEDIRGFMSGGFSEMNNKEGDLSSLGPQFCIDQKDFLSTILPNLGENDTVIFIFTVDEDFADVEKLAGQVKSKTSNLQAICHEHGGCRFPVNINNIFASKILRITWTSSAGDAEDGFFMRLQWELSTKWILNAISTGAHILKGKVYKNYMIDLKVTNSKLYRRAIGMLQRFTGCSWMQGERALLRALYRVEELTEEMITADVSRHTQAANASDKVVPTALVVLQTGCSVSEAQAHLREGSVVRDAVEACLTSGRH
ncbi:glucokinase regulatory protein [Clupea harengus]|uniref:Glucokinase regulatory protein n=1 Tax=Clupea harengus TaxID=7950 RepID=A0A6P8GH37_CLUHA|nr:glucokinase regulatory protein [Clupea harengus]